jgi:hypothetical protein
VYSLRPKHLRIQPIPLNHMRRPPPKHRKAMPASNVRLEEPSSGTGTSSTIVEVSTAASTSAAGVVGSSALLDVVIGDSS